ncbi:hypothetical protein BJP40_15455 [Streptomyces sp. CC53]|uniref:hypothetical protein n=1 Tax=unclassified Streptomyces TaxID=2593676 RepID=UPI0008DE6D2D|nr:MULTISPECIES: hypothetical protein [unclassified Streptomyces]OII65837.1 hypothetical protein BJP40_15455 [Streptomyces sp. CC53]
MTPPSYAERWPPSYPPKTPPPPKRPVEPPRPEPGGGAEAAATLRVRARIANRRAGNWTYSAEPWATGSTPRRAGRDILERLRTWGYRLADDHPVVALTERLVREAAADGGRRVSVHLADDRDDRQVAVMVLSHGGAETPEADGVLAELVALGAVSVGTENSRDDGGRRRWAVVGL